MEKCIIWNPCHANLKSLRDNGTNVLVDNHLVILFYLVFEKASPRRVQKKNEMMTPKCMCQCFFHVFLRQVLNPK